MCNTIYLFFVWLSQAECLSVSYRHSHGYSSNLKLIFGLPCDLRCCDSMANIEIIYPIPTVFLYLSPMANLYFDWSKGNCVMTFVQFNFDARMKNVIGFLVCVMEIMKNLRKLESYIFYGRNRMESWQRVEFCIKKLIIIQTCLG